jgi:hypothetical protein
MPVKGGKPAVTERIPISPLPEDLADELIELLHAWGDRYQLLQGIDDDGWYLRITDRPAVPNERIVIARCVREARTMLKALDEGLP